MSKLFGTGEIGQNEDLPTIDDLNNELEQLSIEETEKQNLTNIYDSWISCKQKQINIKNFSEGKIKISTHIEMRDSSGLVQKKAFKSNSISINQYSIRIENCENIHVNISNKFNNLFIMNCENIIISLDGGLISGMDILHSKNINCIIKKDKVYYISCANTNSCMFNLDLISFTSFLSPLSSDKNSSKIGLT